MEGGSSKVVYGQEPPSGESTTTECGFDYQLLAVITKVAQLGAPSCSQPQPVTDNGVRNGRSNWLVAPPTLHRAVPPWAPRIAHCNAGYRSQDLLHWVSSEPATSECQTNALPVRPLRVWLRVSRYWKTFNGIQSVDKGVDKTTEGCIEVKIQ